MVAGHSQCVEEEGEVRIERRVVCRRDVVMDPLRERGRGEDEDHDDVRANPGEDDVRPAVAVVVGLLRRGVAVLLLLMADGGDDDGELGDYS